MSSSSPIVRSLQRMKAAKQQRQAEPSTATEGTSTQTDEQSPTELADVSAVQTGDAATSSQASLPESAEGLPKNQNGRTLQCVLTKAQRYKIVKWMVDTAAAEGDETIASKTVKQFPSLFRSSANANLLRASRYWKQRSVIISSYKQNGKRHNGVYTCVATRQGIKVRIAKAAGGRGRRVTPWVKELYAELLDEFQRLRKVGVKFNVRLLRQLALKIVADSTGDILSPTSTDPRSGRLIRTHINTRWIESFMQKNNIVCRMQVGKLSVSAAKQQLIDREVAFHLGGLCRDFNSGVLHEEDVYNADETHFKIDTNDGRTLAMRGDEEVRFADVVSGDDGMTMMLLLGGCPQAEMGLPLIVFKNDNSSYPIRGVADDVPGVAYRSQPKGWMDRRVFAEWLNESRIFKSLPNGRKRVLFVDNAGGHAETEEVRKALEKTNTELRLLPKNATELCQPADSFVIQKVKTAWRTMWDEKRMSMVSNEEWTNWKNGSGKLPNPGKRFFLQLAAAAVRDVAQQRDSDGVLYTRKAMIRCGMALNLNGRWEVKQLFPHLQEIVKKYEENFNGVPVTDSLALDGEITQSDSDNE